MVGGGDPFCMKVLVNQPHWSEIADFQPIFARSASVVTPSEKVQLALKRSPIRAFQRAQDDHHTLPLSRPPKGASKTPNGIFPGKIALRLTKVCYKVSSCKHRQGQTCKAFIGLTILAKIIGGAIPSI